MLRRHKPIIVARATTVVDARRRRPRGARRPRALHGRATTGRRWRRSPARSSSALDDTPLYRHDDAALRRARSGRDDLRADRRRDARRGARARRRGADGADRRGRAARRPGHRPRDRRLLRHARARTPRRSCAGRATSSSTSSSTSDNRAMRERALADAAECARTRRADRRAPGRDRGRRGRPRRRPHPAAALPGDGGPPRHRDPPQPHRADRGLDPDGLQGVRGGVEELLRRARGRARARAGSAARDGDRELVGALRVRGAALPPADLALLRICGEDADVAAGTERETTIRRARRCCRGDPVGDVRRARGERARRVPRRPPVERLHALRPRAAHVLRPADHSRPPPGALAALLEGRGSRARAAGKLRSTARSPRAWPSASTTTDDAEPLTSPTTRGLAHE